MDSLRDARHPGTGAEGNGLRHGAAGPHWLVHGTCWGQKQRSPPSPLGRMGSGRNALWTPPGDMCLQVSHPGGAQHHLCSVMLGCFPEFNHGGNTGRTSRAEQSGKTKH